MKICWDNLERVKLSKCGNLVASNCIYVEMESCVKCGKSYLAARYSNRSLSKYCSKSCGKIGHKVDAVTKDKIRNTRLKRKCGIGNKYALGMKHTDENKKLFAVQSREVMLKRIENGTAPKVKGCNNPNWKGGVSKEPYCPDWTKDLKGFVKERDGYRCMNPYCISKTPNDLTVHHVDYNKKSCGTKNLITLCRSCNSKANFDRDWHQDWYSAILYIRYGRK